MTSPRSIEHLKYHFFTSKRHHMRAAQEILLSLGRPHPLSVLIGEPTPRFAKCAALAFAHSEMSVKPPRNTSHPFVYRKPYTPSRRDLACCRHTARPVRNACSRLAHSSARFTRSALPCPPAFLSISCTSIRLHIVHTSPVSSLLRGATARHLISPLVKY